MAHLNGGALFFESVDNFVEGQLMLFDKYDFKVKIQIQHEKKNEEINEFKKKFKL